MLRKLTALFPLMVAAVLALATWWLQHMVSQQSAGNLDKTRNDPDAIVENFVISRFKGTGDLSVSLTGERMSHYPVDDAADVDVPVVTFLGNGSTRKSVWQGDKAFVTQKGELVELKGNVIGTREGDRSHPATQLKTGSLNLRPRDELAYTSAPLAVTQGRLYMTGTGGEWNNITGLLQIWQLDATFNREDKK